MARNKWTYKKVRVGGKESTYNIGTININKMTDSQIAEINGNLERIEKNILEKVEKLLPNETEREEFKEAVVAAFMTKFTEKIMPKFDEISGIKTAVVALEKKLDKWEGKNFENNYAELEKDIKKVVAAGQEAQGKNLKALLEKQEEQDKINRRLDLYMTSTEKTIAENTAQLKKIEEMLQLKEEQDRKDFDAIKKGIEGLGEDNKAIKQTIGELLTKDDAFAKFQELRKGNDDIKQQNNDIKTLLINLAEKVCKPNDLQDVLDAIKQLDDGVTNGIKSAIAESDAKLLGMIMPKFAAIEEKLKEQKQIQTTILNSILSGQQDNALQYVAMSEKLDNLTELVSALGTKMQNQSFDDNKVVELLENFATSQEAAFAKVTKKEDLKHVDTGIDSIINMLSDNSITLEMMNKAINSMASQINVVAIDIKRVLEILSQTRIELSTVADCDRCHSADSMFYKCQICGNEGRTNVASNDNCLACDQTNEKSRLIIIRPRNNGNIIIDNSIENSSPKIDKNNVEQIIFDACFRGQNKCNEKRCADCEKCSKDCQKDNGKCEREVKIELYGEASRVAKTAQKENLLDYFPNLKVVSFAKPLDGKPKYILTSKLFYDTTKGKVHTSLTYYGGQYIKSMEKSVFNIKDKTTGQKFLEDIGGRDLHNRITADNSKNNGDGYWRLPYKSIEE